MDGLKSDNETELTSTMGNALSVTNKDEKNETNDATPTSSTDASTASTASRIVSDDPISSTSSDTIEQTKASEMNQSVTDLLENIPSERITEDVEDLVHDLESLLGESTDSFSIPIRTPPEELKDAEDVVSQTSRELNTDQEEQPAIPCDEDTHSEDTTLTLETSSICEISAEVSEELGPSGSSTKIETDITSSETCVVENVEECNDANVPPQTITGEIVSIGKEIQLAQETQEIQVEKGNIEDSESEATSKICDETERPTVDIVSDSGDTTDLEDMQTKEAVDKADEHVAEKGDEPKPGITLEAEGEEDSSSQTCTRKDDHLEEIEQINKEDGNAAALDEGIEKQNVISTPEIEMADQDPDNKTVEETAAEDAETSEVDKTLELKPKEIAENSNSLECAQKITENSELSTEIPESTCSAEDPQKAVEVTPAIDEETNEKVVEDCPAQDSKYSEDSCQPELPMNAETKDDEGVISTTKLTVPELPVGTETEIQNLEMLGTPEVVPEISEVTMSGCPKTSEIEETGSEAEPNEDIEPITVSSKSIEVTDNNPGEDTAPSVATVDDIETVSSLTNLSETIDSSNAEIPECSVDITTSVAAKCEDECENMDFECAAPSSLSEITEIANETTHNKDIVVVEEAFNETLKEVEPEAECNKVEHLEAAENQPSTCTEEDSEDTVEVANAESLEEITDTGEDIPEKTESNDIKECANEPLEGVIVNQAENEECSENKTDNICAEQVIVEESQTSESDDYKGDSEIHSKETDDPSAQAETEAEPAASETVEAIPQNDATEVLKTDKNITQAEDSDSNSSAKETLSTVELKDQGHESDLPQTEILSDKSNREVQEPKKIYEKATSILNNKEDMEVGEESVTCHEIYNNTERLEVEMRVEDLKMKTDDLSPGKPVIQEVECCQSDETIIEKPEMDLKQLADSSEIVEELEKEEKLIVNKEQVEQTSVEESTALPIEKESTSKVNDISFIDGNEVEETKESEVENKVEIISTDSMVSEVNEGILSQPDSTQTIDTYEKTTVEVLEVAENDSEDSDSSEDSEDNQKNYNVPTTHETISDDESSPAESDKTTEVSIDSFEKDPKITKGKPPMIAQLEFAPLVLSEEDSEEEAVPMQVLEPKVTIAPHEEIEENEEDPEELPQIEEILENQPMYIESATSSVDMQENLETILAVASLQKIDIPKVTEPERLLSENERSEMEALRRAVESITDNSADAYVEEVEELINIPMLVSNVCDQNVSLEQPIFMEAETESVLKSEDETIALQKEEQSVPDEGSNLIRVEEYPDTNQIVDSSESGYKIAENVQKINCIETQKDEKNSQDIIEPKQQNLETEGKNVINFPQDIEQSNADSNTPNIEQNVTTSMEVEAAPEEVNSGHDLDKSNLQSVSTSDGKDDTIRDNIEDITVPKGDGLNIEKTDLEVDELEADQNVEESNEAEASQKVDKSTASDIGESQEINTTQKVDAEKCTELVTDLVESQGSDISHTTEGPEIIPKVGESQETEISMEEKEGIETVPEVAELQDRHTTQSMSEKDGTDTDPEVRESHKREATQTVHEMEGTEIVSEVVESTENEATQTVDEMESTETVPEVGESQKTEATEVMDEKTATETEVEESHEKESTETMDKMEGTEIIPEVGETQKTEATETMDEKKATETEVGEMTVREATETVDEMEGTAIVPEVGESQKIEAIKTMVEKKGTESKVEERPKREAAQIVDEMEVTDTAPEVVESQKIEATETMDKNEATETEVRKSQEATETIDEKEETFPEVEESQKREATQTTDGNETTETVLEVEELQKREATHTVDEKQDTKTLPEVEASQKREATQTMDEKEVIETAPDELQEREVTQKIDSKKCTKTDPEVGELQERDATETVDEMEGIETVPEVGELQEREATQKIGEEKITEPVPEVGESQQKEAIPKMGDKKGTEPVPEVVESKESEASQEVNEEKATETDSDVDESQEREASQKMNDRDAVQKEDQEESTSTDPENEESQEREASQKDDNETDPDIGDSQEREATQKIDESKMPQRRTGLRNSLPEQETLIDSSQVITENEATPAPTREKEVKVKANERPKRHKKSDNKLEELSINVDVPDREKPYSPKITIKPIKVPDEEVSTTSNSDAEVTKGSLKMTITKQSDKLHSVLKVCDSENPESTTDMEEPIPKLIIKPKVQQMEQQHSPKMSTRSSNQRSLSPRITIKPVVKPEKQEAVSPLKIKIGLKSEETPKKHSSKTSARSTSKQEEDSPRKVLIKPVVKTLEETEPIVSPRITIKPIPKPEAEKELVSRVNIKSIRKQDEENDEKERSSPKITIKPVIKPQEIDSHQDEGEEVKERIVLKINKGNLPTPTKDSKKREHLPDDEKSEKLAKITVKFSKGGGHPHIVQQMEEVHKRPHEELNVPEKNKKQKVDAESTMSTRSRHKEVAVEAPVETKSRHKEHAEGSDFKSKLKDIENPQFEFTKSSKHKDLLQESPIEAKRMKLKDSVSDFPARQSRRSSSRSRQKDSDNAEDIQIVEPKLNSPIVISEDSRSQDSGSVILIEDSKEDLSLNLSAHSLDSPKGTPKSDSVVSTPSTTPTPRKRGRPRKVPIEVREEFKEQEEPPVKSKPKPEEEAPAVQSAPESGRPKRSCRGPSVCDRLGIKPRKPRGPGRGRGGKRGMGTRPIPMKPEKSSK